MADETFEPDVLRVFGGLCTVVARGQLGKGMSPACNDVEFFPAVVQSRPGYALRYTDTSPFRGIATFIDQTGARYIVTLQGNGNIAYDCFGLDPTSEAILRPIAAGVGADLYMKAKNAFGRLIACFSDSAQHPVDFPISWNLLNGYRGLATTPPTRAMTAADGAASTAPNLAGLRYYTVTFEDDLGYETKAGPPVAWTSAADKKISLTAIPLGPAGTVRRHIWATAKDQADLFSLGKTAGFVIDDNTTTTATLDFTDTDLVSNGVPYDALLTLAEPRIAAGLGQYGNRLALHGVYQTIEARIIKSVLTPTTAKVTTLGPIDADFDIEAPGTVAGEPWTAAVAGPAGTGLYADTPPSTRSKYWRIYGDGATIGSYTQVFNQAITSPLQQTQQYFPIGARVGIVIRAKASSNSLATGGILIKVTGNTTSNAYLWVVLTGAELTTEWKTFVLSGFGNVVGSGTTEVLDPKDEILTLRISAASGSAGIGALPNGEWVGIDFYRFLDARYSLDTDRVWFSSSIQQPGQFDLVASPLEIALGNGEKITGLFEQSGNYYVLKQRSWWVTSDTGDDPSNWNLDNVSPVVGSPSLFGWDVGPDFAIVCDLSGVYKFTGGAPEKISDEIENRWQADLDTANAHRMWCVIDPNKKIVRIGIPVKGGAAPGPCHEIFVLNYVEGWDSGVPNGGVGRKWSVDTVASTGGAIIQLDALQRRFALFGERTSTNFINEPNVLAMPPWTDDSCAVPPTLSLANDPFGGINTTTRVSWAGGGTTRFRYGLGPAVAEGEYYVAAFWAKTSGTPFPITVKSDLAGVADQTFTPTSKWVRYVFRFGPAGVGGGTASIWLDFGSPVAADSIVVYGMQIQTGAFDRGFFQPTVPYPLTGEAGFVSVPGEPPDFSPKLTDDWDNMLAPTYTTWAFQSDVGRSLYDKIVFRVEGAGNLLAAWVRPDNVVQYLPGSTAPNTAPLASPARYDIELGDNVEDINAAVQLSTFQSGAWWSLSRLAVLLKPSPYSTLRR